jgi:hypothetical protein
MLDYRNLLSHTYNPAVFEQAVAAIHQRYLPAPAQAPPGWSGSWRAMARSAWCRWLPIRSPLSEAPVPAALPPGSWRSARLSGSGRVDG